VRERGLKGRSSTCSYVHLRDFRVNPRGFVNLRGLVSLGLVSVRAVLRRPSWPYRQIPHLGQDARHLHPVQLRDERQQLRDELIFH
jgi:hypothetical protein